MNYVWDLLIRAERAGMIPKELTFAVAKVYSPYLELSHAHLNFTEVEPEVEINPYYRFQEIFKDLFHPDYLDDAEFRAVFFDMAIHFLASIDRMQGMTKIEYYIRFVLDDIRQGLFGESIQDNIKLFTKDEQYLIARNILRLHTTGEMLYLLQDTMWKIFEDSIVYANYETKDEVLFYLGYEKNAVNQVKLEFIKTIFLPLRFRTEEYWEYHFGIIGNPEAMKIDGIVLY